MDDPIFESCVELKVWRTRHASEAACLRSPGGYLETDETEIDGIQVSEVHCATANKFAARSVMRTGNSAGWVECPGWRAVWNMAHISTADDRAETDRAHRF